MNESTCNLTPHTWIRRILCNFLHCCNIDLENIYYYVLMYPLKAKDAVTYINYMFFKINVRTYLKIKYY